MNKRQIKLFSDDMFHSLRDPIGANVKFNLLHVFILFTDINLCPVFFSISPFLNNLLLSQANIHDHKCVKKNQKMVKSITSCF